MKSSVRLSLATILSVGALSSTAVANTEPKVVVSIMPLKLITQAILPEGSHVDVLIPAGANPHSYSLRPSDVKKVGEADRVVWLGPELEMFLAKLIDSHSEKSVALLAGHEVHDDHDEHKGHGEHDDHKGHDDHDEHDDHKGHDDHDEHDDHKSHDEHDHGGMEVHLWLDPIESIEIAEQVTESLVDAFPQLSTELNGNFDEFRQNVLQLDQEIQAQLSPYQQSGFFVFHDAWGTFVERYNLNQLGYFTIEPARPPGARKLIDIRRALGKNKTCVFIEPQFGPKVVDSVTQGLDVAIGRIDPLASWLQVDGTEIDPKLGYINYMTDVANQFENCFKSL